MDKQEKLSVRQSFVQKLENKILSGELSVSELVSKGFLEVMPRHGTYVADYREKGIPEALMAIFRLHRQTMQH